MNKAPLWVFVASLVFIIGIFLSLLIGLATLLTFLLAGCLVQFLTTGKTRECSLCLLALALVGVVWYNFNYTGSGAPKEETLGGQVSKGVAEADATLGKNLSKAVEESSRDIHKRNSTPDQIASNLNQEREFFETVTPSLLERNKAAQKFKEAANSNGFSLNKIISSLAKIDLNVDQNWSTPAKLLALGVFLLLVGLVFRKVPKEKRSMAGSLGALLVLLAVVLMLWPNAPEAVRGVDIASFSSSTSTHKSKPKVNGLEQYKTYEGWEVIYKDYQLSTNEWTPLFDSTRYAKWRLRHSEPIEAEVNSRIIRDINPGYNFGPNAKVRFRGNAQISLWALPRR